MFARLLLFFIAIPLIELVLFLLIGSKIGLIATVAIVILTGILGAALTRIQGLKTLARYQEALAQGRMPHEEVVEGFMILVAGAVLLTPGFLTDAIGFLLLIPVVRTKVRLRLMNYLKTRIQNTGATMPGMPPQSAEGETTSPVIEIEAEVVDERPKG